MKTKTVTDFRSRFRNSRLVRRVAGAAFLFFLIKGLVWLGIAAAAAWSAFRFS